MSWGNFQCCDYTVILHQTLIENRREYKSSYTYASVLFSVSFQDGTNFLNENVSGSDYSIISVQCTDFITDKEHIHVLVIYLVYNNYYWFKVSRSPQAIE